MAANGYIGKISAVVTANTSAFSRQLANAGKSVNAFENTLNSSLTRASNNAQGSLQKIFTQFQQLEGRLKTAVDLNLRTDGQAGAIRAITQVAEQLNRPLERAQKQFSALSLEAAAGFAPALQRVQDSVVAVNKATVRTGQIAESSFSAATAEVQRTTQALARLTQAQQLAGQGLTGNELQFADPRLFQTLQASARTTAAAGALPAVRLESGDIARQIRQLKQYESAAIEAQATVENLRLDPNVSPERILAAERRLQQLTETARRAQRAVSNAVGVDDETARLIRRERGGRDAEAARLARQDFTVRQAAAQSSGLGLFGSQGGTAEQRALTSARELSAQFAKLPESAQQGLSGLAGIAANLANRVDQGRASAEQLEAVLARLQARIEAASPAAAIARANEQLALVPDQPPPPPPRTDLGDGLAQAGRSRIEQLTGNVNIDSTPTPGVFNQQAQRDIDALATRVGNVRQQLETLPNSVRTRFIPELQRAQAQLVKLQNSPRATAKEIENAARRVDRLEASARRAQAALNFRKSFGGAGLRGIEEGLNQQALQGYNAQLQLLQQTLAGTSQAARGPAVAAFNNLRNAIADAMDRGTLETAQTRREIQRLTQEAVRATAAAAGIGERGLTRRLQRVGDIGRGAFGNLGLGVQQAVFAVDDFFSVTGGLEQSLRAAGNNISQLGFVLGGTAGLITGVAVSLGAQLTLALIRFANAGIEGQDRTKSLNDALARQKSLVEELAEAFRSLGDDLARRVFSAPGQQAREFAKELGEIAKKQRELNEARLADLDPDVQRARAVQNRIDRELPNENNPGRRISLIRERRQAERDEREASRRAANADVTDVSRVNLGRFSERQRRRLDLAGGRQAPQDVQGLALAVQNVERLAAERALLGIPGRPAGTVRNAEAIAAGSAAVQGVDAGDAIAVRALVRRQLEEASRIASGTGGFFGDPQVNLAREQLPALQRLLEQLESPVRLAIAALEVAIIRASNSAAVSIEAAQEDVADAIQRGVRGASDFQAALDESARQLDEANQAINAAAEIENPEERERAVRQAQDRVRDVRLRQEAINEASREVRLGRSFGGRRTEAALSSLEGNERFVNEQARLTARVAAAVDAELQARRNLESAIAGGDQAAQKLAREELEAAQAASDLAAAAAEAALSLEQAFTRIRKTADNFLAASEGLADDAQRRLDELDPNAPGAPDRSELTRERDEAERQLVQDRRRNRELQNRLDRERTEAGNDPRVRRIDARLEQLRSEREDAAARARIDGVSEDPAAAQARADEEARLLAERENIVRDSTRQTQSLIDEENRLAAARRRAIEEVQRQREFEAEVARRRSPEGDAVRGLDLLNGPAERAANELNQNFADINAAFDRQQEAILDRTGGRPQDAQDELDELGRRRREAIDRSRDDAARAAAPAIFSLFDSVRNAVAAGPSRAALTASDISTSEGARELNRLIRGDDAARDVNLIELQEQTRLLRELVEKTDPAAVAN
jgi:hypothetical protein